jgi:hypothetical protein
MNEFKKRWMRHRQWLAVNHPPTVGLSGTAQTQVSETTFRHSQLLQPLCKAQTNSNKSFRKHGYKMAHNHQTLLCIHLWLEQLESAVQAVNQRLPLANGNRNYALQRQHGAKLVPPDLELPSAQSCSTIGQQRDR